MRTFIIGFVITCLWMANHLIKQGANQTEIAFGLLFLLASGTVFLCLKGIFSTLRALKDY